MWDWKGWNRFRRSHNVSGCLGAGNFKHDQDKNNNDDDENVVDDFDDDDNGDSQESWVHGKTGACGFAGPNTEQGF